MTSADFNSPREIPPNPPFSNNAKYCTACGSRIETGFRFCGECGAEVPSSSTAMTETAVTSAALPIPDPTQVLAPFPPTDTEPASSRRRRKSRRRKVWYKRPFIVIPVTLLGILLLAASVVAYRTMSAFDEVQSVSTPPAEVSGILLGGDESLVIDTDAARQAVLQEQEREGNLPPNGSNQDPVSTADTGFSEGTQQSPIENTPASSSNNSTTEATQDSSVDTSTNEAAAPVPTSAPVVDSPGTNILLMGVDARDGESIDIGVRPDSLAVLNLNEETGSCRILAVPRDSRVELPGYGQSKVNHALAVGGIPYEQLVIERYLGIQIDHYALIDFSALVQVVDSVGGVTVDNPEAFTIGETSFDAGSIHLDGDDALSYARYRGGPDGDFGRISRQQQVLRGLMDQVYDVNLVKLVPNMFTLLSDNFRTDYGATDLIRLADTWRTSCTSADIETRTIPGDVQMAFDDLMQMELSFVISDPAAVRDDVDWLLERETP